MTDPYRVTRDFEAALCEYTGARYAVAVNSCTAALQLVVMWFYRDGRRDYVEIPRRTYVSVPAAVILAGARVVWRDEDWVGSYQLAPLPVWDCARRFTCNMYVPGQFQCVSFSASKILSAEQGGAILHDNDEADAWFRRMRFDGRTEGVSQMDDTFREVGLHCLMIPSVAAGLLLKLYHLPKVNADLPRIEYPDLSLHEAFK